MYMAPDTCTLENYEVTFYNIYNFHNIYTILKIKLLIMKMSAKETILNLGDTHNLTASTGANEQTEKHDTVKTEQKCDLSLP